MWSTWKRRVTPRSRTSSWFLRVSWWFLAYVLKVHVYVLMVSCVCPHAFCVSGKTKVGVWGPPELVDLCWRETFGSFYDVVSEGSHKTYIPPLFKVHIIGCLLMSSCFLRVSTSFLVYVLMLFAYAPMVSWLHPHAFCVCPHRFRYTSSCFLRVSTSFPLYVLMLFECVHIVSCLRPHAFCVCPHRFSVYVLMLFACVHIVFLCTSSCFLRVSTLFPVYVLMLVACVLVVSFVHPHAFCECPHGKAYVLIVSYIPPQGRYRTTKRSTSFATLVYIQSTRSRQQHTLRTITTCLLVITIGCFTARRRGTTSILWWRDKYFCIFSMQPQNSEV